MLEQGWRIFCAGPRGPGDVVRASGTGRGAMQVDRRAFLATLGVGTLEFMDPEDKAEALEH